MKTTKTNQKPQSAIAKALKFLSYKNRSLKEINDYLVKKNFSSIEIGKTIEKLIEYKFIDDDKFSEIFIRSRQLKGKSKKLISLELKQKGINVETIEKNLEKSQDDLKTAKQYLEKRINQFKNLDPEKRKNRIISRLQSRGYNWDIIREILKNI